jgi:hypothetical protein
MSTIYGIIKLSKPGISQEIRRLVLFRHILALFVFNLSYIYITINLFFYACT